MVTMTQDQIHKAVRDPWLATWSDWIDHDGNGVPSAIVGRRVKLSGVGHDGRSQLPTRELVMSPEYASSADSAVWNWSKGLGGVVCYRLQLHHPIDLPEDALNALDRLRCKRGGQLPPLLLGLDGLED
ncbi:hypothetical protein U5903_21880 [Cereibacter johrii]|uniref:hypothetical protein n=1 Tax=Cereibacter johrii TaxID=445629 RepID=UPI002B26030D|nr:hypothetical protein [Cereibacter johrii]MEA5163435.1 hypothetical protein [Cereibacter johrii]